MVSFPPTGVPSEGDLVLLTDELSSPADFLLYRFLASHLKETEGTKAVVLTVSGNITKWKTIAAKTSQSIDAHAVTFLDVVVQIPTLPHVDEGAVGVLKPVFDQLDGLLAGAANSPSTLVILDDLSSLEWLGAPTQDLLRFVRALAALCRKYGSSLVIRHHVVTPGEPDDLLRLLLQICACHVDVFPLSTGRSGAVSGQIALHPGPGQLPKTFRPVPRGSAIQYKLTDTGCVFFERGTSSGVL